MKIKLSNLRIQLYNKLFSLNNLKKHKNDKTTQTPAPPPPSPDPLEIYVIDDYANDKKNIPGLILHIPTIQEAAKKTINIDEWETISNESIYE
jgi:hypothetical protein